LSLHLDGASAERLDGCGKVVGGLAPAEAFRIVVSSVDIGGDGGLELVGGALAPRWICCSVSRAKKRSTLLIQNAEIG
jgi:hypothetical protein